MAVSLFMFEIVGVLFDRDYASSIVNSALATNILTVPFCKGRQSRVVNGVFYRRVGYHSSWLSNLSLTHHILVWWAAEQVYPGRKFLDYALLGDDIAIADRLVALYFGLATPRRYHLRTEVSDLGVRCD